MVFVLLAFAAFFVVPIMFVLLCISPEKNMPFLVRSKDEKQIGFWQRQFQSETTLKQQIFDWLFGIILPVICFAFDPIVFNGNKPTILSEYKPFAYLLSFASIIALLGFLLLNKRLKWLNGFLSGFFALGGTISLIVGIRIFPYSLVGLIILIGALGFTPLFSAFVYWRNAVRAYKYAQSVLGKQTLIYSAILSVLFGFVTPYLINMKIQQDLKEIENGNIPTIQKKTDELSIFSPILNPVNIWEASFHEEMYSPRKKALRDSYKALSGDKPEGWD